MMTPTLLRLLLALVVLAIVDLLPPAAEAQTRLVNCSLGRRIGPALRVPAGRPLTIRISGTCNENVAIAGNDVTLVAAAPGATIHGTDPARNTIQIEGAKGVVIDGLRVTGARHGIVGLNGAVFAVQNAIVENNAQNGIVASFNSTATVIGTTVRNNGLTGDPQLGRNGIVMTDTSSGTVLSSTITGNGANGVTASRNSSVRIGRNSSAVDGPNEITGNGSSGISVFQSSQAVVWGNTVHHNTGSGIYVEGGSATIVLNAIESNDGDGITVTNSGGARIGYDDATVAHRRTDCLLVVGGTLHCTNKIRLNGSDGIEVSNGANANYYGNLIEDNEASGVVINNATGRSLGNNTVRNNAENGMLVTRGQFLQGPGSLSPSRELITGNGTAHRSDPSSGWGILAFGAATANLGDFEISGNFRDGVLAYAGAAAVLRSSDPARVSVVENSGTGNAPGSGVSATLGGTLEVRGIAVRNNKTHGVSLSTGSKAVVSPHLITDFTTGIVTTIPVTVSGNAFHGIAASTGSSVDINSRGTPNTNTKVTGNGPVSGSGHGLDLSIGSSASVTDAQITGNKGHGINLSGESAIQIRNTSLISGNTLDGVVVEGNSFVNVSGSAAIKTNGRHGLNCSGQSRVQGTLSGITENATGGSGSNLNGSVLGNITVNLDPATNTPATLTLVGPTALTTSGGTCQ